MTFTRLFSLSLLALLLAAAPAPAQAGPIAGEPVERSFVFGGHAFVDQGTQLGIVDLAGGFVRVLPTGGVVRGMAHLGTTLYVATDAGVKIFDISSPGAPVLVGQVVDPGWGAGAVATHGPSRRLYVSEQLAGVATKIRVLDASSPTNPRSVGVWPLPGSQGGPRARLAAHGAGHLLVNGLDNGTWLLDVRNPQAIGVAAQLPTETHPQGLLSHGGRAYLHRPRDMTSGWLSIFDASTPSSPRRESLTLLPSACYDVNALTLSVRPQSTTAYTGGALGSGYSSEELCATDVTVPSRPGVPFRIRLTHPGGFDVVPMDVDALGDRLYVPAFRPPHPPLFQYEYHLVTVDISTPTRPRPIDFTPVPTRDRVVQAARTLEAAAASTTLESESRELHDMMMSILGNLRAANNPARIDGTSAAANDGTVEAGRRQPPLLPTALAAAEGLATQLQQRPRPLIFIPILTALADLSIEAAREELLVREQARVGTSLGGPAAHLGRDRALPGVTVTVTSPALEAALGARSRGDWVGAIRAAADAVR